MAQCERNDSLPRQLPSQATSSGASPGWVPDRCIRSHPHHLECNRCVSSCPEQALVFVDDPGPRLLATDACHGCGACVPACPTEALLGEDLEQAEQQLAALSSSASVRLACHRVPPANEDDRIRLHCLRTAGDDQLTAWQARFPGQPLVIEVAEDCRQCQAAPLTSQDDPWLEMAERFQVARAVTPEPFRKAEGAVVSRRQFFTASRPATPVYSASDTDVRARRQQRHYQALSFLEGQTDRRLPDLAWPLIELDESRCDASGVCIRVCPSDALALDPEPDQEQGAHLTFSPLQCIDCGYCVENCPQSALQLTAASSSEPVSLRQSALRRCFECGRRYTTTGEPGSDSRSTCPACVREKALLKESFSQLFG